MGQLWGGGGGTFTYAGPTGQLLALKKQKGPELWESGRRGFKQAEQGCAVKLQLKRIQLKGLRVFNYGEGEITYFQHLRRAMKRLASKYTHIMKEQKLRNGRDVPGTGKPAP